MYRKNKISAGTMPQSTIKAYEAEPLEAEIRRMLNNNEPLEATPGAKNEYTDRKDGVINRFNIRNDKWEEFAEGMDKVAELHHLAREIRTGERTYDTMTDAEQQEFNKKFPGNKHAIAAKMKGNQET